MAGCRMPEGALPVVLALATLAAAVLGGCKRSDAAEEPRGDALFASTCARCHGADGAGGATIASGQTPRNFRDHAFQTSRTDAELRQVIARGKPPGMPAFAGTFDDAQIGALVGYVRKLDPERR